jgi:hypothetical protein
MRVFLCPVCGARVYFHNTACRCGADVAFDPEVQTMTTAVASCANRVEIGCNWQAESAALCRACALTEVVPDLRAADNLPLWQKTEEAKRWVLACLMRWGWFTAADPGPRPDFRMLSEQLVEGATQVVMGHAEGVITLNVSEAAAPVRAARQAAFGELYRTMIGHVRHEMAHFLFDRLASEEAGFLTGFRALFGDERADYAAALQAHYDAPTPRGGAFVTSYASAHPHEDWAETLAHLMHLTDLLDSGAATGLTLRQGLDTGYDAYAEADTETLLGQAVDLTLALNHVNRALDLPDLYPFVLTPQVRDKMGFAHRALRRITV